jgi:Ino eighty subunit 2
MLLSFLVPTSLLPMPYKPAAVLNADGDTKMGAQEQQVPKPCALAICDMDGCSEKGKYRLIRDQAYGACRMSHLHLLEKQLGVVAV